MPLAGGTDGGQRRETAARIKEPDVKKRAPCPPPPRFTTRQGTSTWPTRAAASASMSSIPAAIRIYEAWSFGSGQSSSGTFQLVNYVTGRCLGLQNGDTSD